MSRRVLRGSLDPSGRLNFDRPARDGETGVTIRPTKNGATLSVRDADGSSGVSVDQLDTTERVGVLRAWMRGDESSRTLFVRDASGQTLELPLKPLKEILAIPDALQAEHLHGKLSNLTRVVAELRHLAVGSVHELVAYKWFDVIETQAPRPRGAPGMSLSRIADSGSLEILGLSQDTIRARYQSDGRPLGETSLRDGDVVLVSVADFQKVTAKPQGLGQSAANPRPILPVMAPEASIPADTIPAPTRAIAHPQRAANIATLAALLQRDGLPDAALEQAYDTMVAGVTDTLLFGNPPRAVRVTIASFPAQLAAGLSMGGYEQDHLAYHCEMLATLEGECLRLQSRLGMEEQYPIRRDGKRFEVTLPEAASSLEAVLERAFGHPLPLGVDALLASFEVGGMAYRTPDDQVKVFRDGQCGAVLFDNRKIGALFTNPHANQIPEGHQLLFGYHSHPEVSSDVLPMARENVDPAEPSSADLQAFSQAARANDRPIPQVIWVRSAEGEVTGRIFVPQKGRFGFETAQDPVAEMKVSTRG